jgi:hypothetical protein
MSFTPTLVTTTTKQKDPQFNPDSEKRNDIKLSSLTGSDKTSSRNGDDGSKQKVYTLSTGLLNKSRGKTTLKSLMVHILVLDLEIVDWRWLINLNKLNNWGEFQNLLDDIKEQKAQYRIDARKARATKSYIEPSPFASYPAEGMENLAEIVGLRNRGIKFTPDLNSANTAQMWLNKKKAITQSDTEATEL